MKHKKIVALVLVCVCAIGSVMFIAEHRQSATENITDDVVVEGSTIVFEDEDMTASEEVVEVSSESTSEEIASTEVTPEDVTEETVAEEKVPTAEELNQIGVTVGDSYEFDY